MAVYETDLKQDKDGSWYRWLGEDQDGTRQKFRLGKDKAEAKKRWNLIVALYQSVSERESSWVAEDLQTAKEIAKGKPGAVKRHRIQAGQHVIVESPETYARRLMILGRAGEGFEAGESLSQAVATIDASQRTNRLIKSKLTGSNPDRDPTGQTVGEALDAYADHLRTQNTLPDASLSPWGKTQVDQIRSWKRFMADAAESKGNKQVPSRLLETDLADLTVARAQMMVDVIRKRPLTLESKGTRRMAVKTCQNLHKSIRHFFDWLDLADEWLWWEPPRFRKLNYTVTPLTDDEKHERKTKKENWRISDDEIRTLIEYATPSERVLILLGLNCAFGAGEIGNLRIPYVKFDTSEIDGIRFKTGVDTRHHLWPETVEALQWELDRREKVSTDESKDVFFLTENGSPLWSKSRIGNYKNGVAKRWSDLIKRVRKDHPKFHAHSFGKLRKTAAIRVIELADAETASMILAHGIPSNDRLLTAYVTIPWQKLYEAQQAYGKSIRPLLKVEKPFEQPAKLYTGRTVIEKILELYLAEVPVAVIAKELNVSLMTVYRYLDRAGLRGTSPPNSQSASHEGLPL